MSYALDSNDLKVWMAPALTPSHRVRYTVVTFDCPYANGKRDPRMMSLAVHLRIVDRRGRITCQEHCMHRVQRHERMWIATRKAIAGHRAARHQPGEP